MMVWKLAASRCLQVATRAGRKGALALLCTLVLSGTLVLCAGPAPVAMAQVEPAAFGSGDWNTFLGAPSGPLSYDMVTDVAQVGDNGVVVVGIGHATWGNPLRPYTPYSDPAEQTPEAFVARLNGQGRVEWNTFLGSGSADDGLAVAVDASGAVFVAGRSSRGWEQYAGDANIADDGFVAKLSAQGQLLWLRLLGGPLWDQVHGLALDAGGNVYVAGDSLSTWGSPKRPYSGSTEGFVAKFAPDGTLLWNTFLGSSRADQAMNVAVRGNLLYVVGASSQGWSSPVQPHAPNGANDLFVAQLTTDGDLNWNTFLGTTADERPGSLVLDSSGQPLVVGVVTDDHGTEWICDGVAGKVDASGRVLWLTRLTGPTVGGLNDVALDSAGNLLAVGVNACHQEIASGAVSGSIDGVVAKLAPDGTLLSTHPMGGAEADSLTGVALVDDTHLLLGGASAGTWGTPVRPFGNNRDGLVAYYTLKPGVSPAPTPTPPTPTANKLYLPSLKKMGR